MQAVLCDTCKVVLVEKGKGPEAKANREVTMETPDGGIAITLDLEKDWCEECARKAFNRMGRAVNDKFRKPRVLVDIVTGEKITTGDKDKKVMEEDVAKDLNREEK